MLVIRAVDRCSCGSILVIGVVIGAVDRWSCGSVLLWIDACDRNCDRSCGSMLVIGAVDR